MLKANKMMRSSGWRFILVFMFVFLSISVKKQCSDFIYHWKLEENNLGKKDTDEQQILIHFSSKQLFVKIMDVDRNDMHGEVPTTSIFAENVKQNFLSITDSLEIIPVVFITVKAIEKTDSDNVKELAKNIVLKTQQLLQE